MLPVFFLFFFVSISDEVFKYWYSGHWLVSNQHFFDNAAMQFPGSVDKIEFFSFRYIDLIKEPFLCLTTGKSYPTEIFARMFFDYEWRFINPSIPMAPVLGVICYVVGMVWVVFFVVTMARKMYQLKSTQVEFSREKKGMLVLLSVCLLFFAVPLVQTIRFPHYTSMKALFMLPGLVLFLPVFSYFMRAIAINTKIVVALICLNIVFGVIFVGTVDCYIKESLGHVVWVY
jgi:hypothetical protein